MNNKIHYGKFNVAKNYQDLKENFCFWLSHRPTTSSESFSIMEKILQDNFFV
jgi:hypothetical protein